MYFEFISTVFLLIVVILYSLPSERHVLVTMILRYSI